MIGIIRVRLSANDAVWSDQEFQTLMDPAVEYSLAHYWNKCSFGFADTTYRLFPPVTIVDPKTTMTAEQIAADPKLRKTRVKVITQAIEDQFHPDWSAFSTLLIWVASPLDLFGTSAMEHSNGQCGIMMCDIASRFDQLCHELGHATGFEHPFGRDGIEYESAYDVMGGYDSEFTRAVLPGFPVGTAEDGTDTLRVIGPMISAAQLSMSSFRPRLAKLFTELSADVKTAPQTVELVALDAAADFSPYIPGPAAAILAPDPVSPDYHYVVELRRSQGYDAGMRSASHPAQPPSGLVVHGYDRATKRFFFAGVLPLSDNVGDRDLHVFSGLPGSDITLRLLEVGPGDAWARVRIGGPNYWRNFGVDVVIRDIVADPTYSELTEVEVRPCFFADLGTHTYRYKTVAHTYELEAVSFGYEVPAYTWMLNGTPLDPERSSVALTVHTSVPDPLAGWQRRTQRLVFGYTITGAHLQLMPPIGDPVATGKFSIVLDVAVNESSPEVSKNAYPERYVTTALPHHGIDLEWDQGYVDGQQHCQEVIDEVDHKRIPVPFPKRRGQRPGDDLPNVFEMVRSLLALDPAAAAVLIDQISVSANVARSQVVAELLARG